MAAPFNAKKFVEVVAAKAVAEPAQAGRVYQLACARLRKEAQALGDPSKRMQMLILAAEFDKMATALESPPPEIVSGDRAGIAIDEAFGVDPDHVVGGEDPMIADMAEAALVGGDSMDQAQAFNALQKRRDRAEAMPVRITPQSAQVSTTVFGRQALVQYGAGSTTSGSFTNRTVGASGALVPVQEAEVVRWQGKENETQTFTITISRIGLGGGATFGQSGISNSFRPFFRMVWGSGETGQPNEIIGDVGRGCQLTAAGNFVYVIVGMDAPLNGTNAGSMVIGGSLGFFSTSRQTPLTRTAYIDNLAVSSSQTIVVPRMAATIEGILTSGANQPEAMTYRIQNADAITIGFIPAELITQKKSGGMVLDNEAYAILATHNAGSPVPTGPSTSTTNVVNAHIIFGLGM